MKSFQILELGSINRNYKLDERTGYYKLLANNGTLDDASAVGLMDLLLQGGFLIRSAKNGKGLILSINTRVTESASITAFKVEKNKLIALVGDIWTPADSIQEYVPPVVLTEEQKLAMKNRVNNFLNLQERIEAKYVPLKLGQVRTPFVNPTQTLEEFITNFIAKYNNAYNTTYVSNGQVQTEAGRRRSLGDIYMLSKHYYPECNLHDVIKFLYITGPTTIKALGSLKCGTINKRVWWLFGSPRFDDKGVADEYGYTFQQYIDRINYVEPVAIVKPVEIDDSDLPEDIRVFNKIKAQFTKGVIFNSMITPNDKFKVDSDNFSNGLRSIILIQKNGSRKQVYDKIKKTTAKIIS